MANFLHGVESIDVTQGGRVVRTSRTGVIGAVLACAAGPVNTPVLVASASDRAQFGPDIDPFSTYVLDVIAQQRTDLASAVVIVVNVCDPDVHRTAQAATNITFGATTDKAVLLGRQGVRDLVVKSADGARTYVAGTDYTLLGNGATLLRLATGTIESGAAVNVAFTYVDPTQVTAADVVGGLNAAGRRTGAQCFLDARGLFGFAPKKLVAPGYASLKTVGDALDLLATTLLGHALVDAPVGQTRDQAIALRNNQASVFGTASRRTALCYPHHRMLRADQTERLVPFSVLVAAAWAINDVTNGFWFSPSNAPLRGVLGPERPLSAEPGDANSDVNLLNAVGIVTSKSDFGTGVVVWGNRSAAFPSTTDMRQFLCVEATNSIVREALLLSGFQFVDQPLSQPLIDDIVEAGNAFFRKLIGDGALLGGKVNFLLARNPKSQLAQGQLVISYRFTPPPPLERLTNETEVTDEFLLTLKEV